VILNVLQLLQGRRRRAVPCCRRTMPATLFHEFGHGLHGILSDVLFPSLSGTSVFTDFVELPSQLYEHWAGGRPEVLRQFARQLPDRRGRCRTICCGASIAARKIQPGPLPTVEFRRLRVCSTSNSTPSRASAERGTVARLLNQRGIGRRSAWPRGNRHAPTGPSNSAISSPAITMRQAYYSYMWSEVMERPIAFGAFEGSRQTSFDAAVCQNGCMTTIYFLRRLARSGRGLCRPSAAGSRRPRNALLRPAVGLLEAAGGGLRMKPLRPHRACCYSFASGMLGVTAARTPHPHVWITSTSEIDVRA